MSLPIFHTNNTDMMLMQTKWSSQINPVLANAVVNGQMLKSVQLASGANTINHKLDRQMQGWFITDVNAAATIYRSQPFNTKTLTLTSSAPAVVDIWVF